MVIKKILEHEQLAQIWAWQMLAKFIRFTEDTKSRGEITMTIGAMDYNPSIAHDMEAAIGLGGYFHEVDLL